LVGLPAAGERDVPTDVVFVFASDNANLFDEEDISSAMFELTSPSGTSVRLTPRVEFLRHFELVPETELEPSTEYTLRATLPAQARLEPSVAVSLSFTTGEGPLSVPPAPPDARMQHYHSTDTLISSCDLGTDGSCIFFPSTTAVVLSYTDSPDTRYLVFGSWDANLSGVNQASSFACVTLRTRAADGTMSDPIELCRDDAETFDVPDLTGLACTENGLAINGVPLGGSGGGGATGGSGGTATGGAETGGTGAAGAATGGATTGGVGTGGATTGGVGTSGSGNAAGAPDEQDDGVRSVLTEGCGCRVPAPAGGAGTASFVAAALSLLVLRRRHAHHP
jgi:hypothetical protein